MQKTGKLELFSMPDYLFSDFLRASALACTIAPAFEVTTEILIASASSAKENPKRTSQAQRSLEGKT